jgi:glutamate-1-semialdehyde aminotransferase
MKLTGTELPGIITPVPGPASRSLARQLACLESSNITCQTPEPPIFWEAARGAVVRDADGNVYVDLTAGFGVARGHANVK